MIFDASSIVTLRHDRNDMFLVGVHTPADGFEGGDTHRAFRDLWKSADRIGTVYLFRLSIML